MSDWKIDISKTFKPFKYKIHLCYTAFVREENVFQSITQPPCHKVVICTRLTFTCMLVFASCLLFSWNPQIFPTSVLIPLKPFPPRASVLLPIPIHHWSPSLPVLWCVFQSLAVHGHKFNLFQSRCRHLYHGCSCQQTAILLATALRQPYVTLNKAWANKQKTNNNRNPKQVRWLESWKRCRQCYYFKQQFNETHLNLG